MASRLFMIKKELMKHGGLFFSWALGQMAMAGVVVVVLFGRMVDSCFKNRKTCTVFFRQKKSIHTYSGWWFQIFYFITPTWGNDPI